MRTELLVLLLVALPGCTPPSVHSLLDLSQQVIERETQHLDEDIARDQLHYQQLRTSLDAAFDADVQQTDDLSPQYVREARQVYAAAREAITRSELQVIDARRARQQNLQAAMHLQQRAASLIEQRDDLVMELYRYTLETTGLPTAK